MICWPQEKLHRIAATAWTLATICLVAAFVSACGSHVLEPAAAPTASTVWNKLDAGMADLYMDYQRVQEVGADEAGDVDPAVLGVDPRIVLTLSYQGDLAPIEALGFETSSDDGQGQASGVLAFEDVERVAQHPNVRLLSVGYPMEPEPDCHNNPVRHTPECDDLRDEI